MKIPVLTLAVVLFTCGAVSVQASSNVALALTPASSAGISSLPAPVLTLAPASAADMLGSNPGSGGDSHFAQFDTGKSLPVSASLVFTLIALFILGLRLMALRQAHAMAEHERHSHHGRAQMFRSLHEERSSRW